MNGSIFADLKTKAADTLWQIGRCYETGDGVGKDEAEAVKWYRMAAEHGNAQALFELGKCYMFGIGVRKDPDAAYLWFCRAALAAPDDEEMYRRVQNQIFEPKLKEILGK